MTLLKWIGMDEALDHLCGIPLKGSEKWLTDTAEKLSLSFICLVEKKYKKIPKPFVCLEFKFAPVEPVLTLLTYQKSQKQTASKLSVSFKTLWN